MVATDVQMSYAINRLFWIVWRVLCLFITVCHALLMTVAVFFSVHASNSSHPVCHLCSFSCFRVLNHWPAALPAAG